MGEKINASAILFWQTAELRTLASHSIPATEMPRRRMTVMVPMIRISLISSVMMASAPFQEHKSVVEVVNANVTTLPNKPNQHLCCFWIFPSGFYGDGMQRGT